MDDKGGRARPIALKDGMRGSLAFGLVALALLAVAPLAQAAPGGGLRQFTGNNGCLTDEASTPAGCDDVRAMQGVNGDMVLSPNGLRLYVPSETKQAIAVFNRDPNTGALTQKSGANGCITSSAGTAASDGCATAATAQLAGVKGLAISPDGNDLYAVNTAGRVLAFDIDGDGNLTYRNESNFCGCDLRAVAVSPDGFNIYIGGPGGPGTSGGSTNYDGIIGVYRRDQTNGAIGLFRQFFPGASGLGGTQEPRLQALADLEVTPDGKQVIASNSEGLACCDWSVVALDRTTTGAAQGDLTNAPGNTARCVSGTSTAGCQTRAGQSYPSGLAIADGGRSIHVAAYETVSTITRDPATGNLTANTGNRCISYSTVSIAGCSASGGPFADFGNMRGIAVTPNGAEMYTGSQNANGGLWGYNRSSDGSFSVKPKPFGCATLGGSSGCATLRGAVPNRTMVAAPGNRNVYAAGGNRLFSFSIDRAPVCSSVATSTPYNTAAGISLSCSDPDGDAISYEIVSSPIRGSLGAVSGNSVTYGPLINTSGQDKFTYRAVAAGVPSDPATVTIDVAGPPPPPPPPPVVTPKPTRILGITMPFFVKKSTKTYTIFTQLDVKGIPSGSTLKVTCKAPKGKKCPAKSYTKRNASGVVKLKKWLKKRLAAGTKLTATVTKTNRIGAVKIMTVKKRARPSFVDRCLPPGAKKPTKC